MNDTLMVTVSVVRDVLLRTLLHLPAHRGGKEIRRDRRP